MENKHKSGRAARRLAAYYVEPQLYGGDLLTTAHRKFLWTIGGKQRWREVLDRAAQLLEVVAEEMQEYRQSREDAWMQKDTATLFSSMIDEVLRIQEELDDMRSNF